MVALSCIATLVLLLMPEYSAEAQSGNPDVTLRDGESTHDLTGLSLEVMYAPTNKLTLMAMLPIKHIEMDMVMDDFHFTEHSAGVGDLQFLALYTVLGSVSKGNRLILDVGMSFPTGSIDEKNTIMGQ